MSDSKPQIKPLPIRNARFTPDTRTLYRKQGLLHSRYLTSIRCSQSFYDPIFGDYVCDNRRFSFKEIFKILQFKRLKRFVYSLSQLTSHELSYVASLFRKVSFRNLASLELYLGTTKNGLESVIRSLGQLSNLESLNIDCSFGDGASLPSLQRTLQKLPQLQKYKVNCSTENKEELQSITKSFYGLKRSKLSSLIIQQYGNRHLTSFLTEVATGVKNLNHLKSLDLGLYDYNIKESMIKPLLETLSHLPYLKSLKAHGLNSKTHEVLFKSLAKMSNLETIDFKLHEVTKESILILAESLHQFSRIKECGLLFTYEGIVSRKQDYDDVKTVGDEVDDETLSILCKSLGKQSKNLQILDFTILKNSFFDDPLKKLTPRSIAYFADIIMDCEQLKHLSLHCVTKLDAATLFQLFASLQKRKMIQSLFLYLTANNQENISDDLFIAFSKALDGLSDLKELHIFFDDWVDVTDKGVQALSITLSSLKFLERINIALQNFPKLTGLTLENLLKGLQQIKSLESADLYFTRQKFYRGQPKLLGKYEKHENIRLNSSNVFRLLEGKNALY